MNKELQLSPTAVACGYVCMSGMKVGDVVAVLGLGPTEQLAARRVRSNFLSLTE